MAKRTSRLPLRAAITFGALRSARPRHLPEKVERVLVAQNLLLGDTLMLAPLVAGVRARYAKAEIAVTCHPAFLPLYEGRPYGARAIPFDPRERHSLSRIKTLGPFDLGLVPAHSRYGWLARAAGAKWVRGFRGGAWYYQASLDETYELPDHLETVADSMAALADAAPGVFNPLAWPAPALGQFHPPETRYAVLHLGAGSPLKYWPADRWQAVAEFMTRQSLSVILSGGPGQEKLVHAVDPEGRFVHTAGRLDLRDMWHLLAQATILVSPDTGIVHLAKLTQTPSVVLFGPGQAALYGPGRFFAHMPYRAVTVDAIPCRDETILFEKSRPWIRTCVRVPQDCHFGARCSESIAVESVIEAITSIMRKKSLR